LHLCHRHLQCRCTRHRKPRGKARWSLLLLSTWRLPHNHSTRIHRRTYRIRRNR
jgi:hypothetical protein